MKFEDLNETIRRCDSRLVRKCVAFERSGSEDMSNATWAKYRSICGIPKSAKKLTDKEAIALLICASMRKRGMKANRVSIAQEGDRLLASCSNALKQVEQMTATRISGQDLPQYLKDVTGRSLSLRTLYRWGKDKPQVPRYSRSAAYNPAQVERWIRAAA